MSEWKNIDEFRSQPSEDARLRKGYTCEVKAIDGSRTLDFLISTDTVDRQGDTVALDGWNFKNYLKNPVVLWAHDYTMLPVARATKLWLSPKGVHATAEFTPAGSILFNDRVFEMYKGGFLSAVSVGFQPTKWAFTEDSGRKFGIDFMEQELLEFSAVPVPANPDALIEARSAGVEVAELRQWAMEVLQKTGQPSDIREFEEFLREAGFSKRDATIIASRGFCLRSESGADPAPKQRDAEKLAESMAEMKRLACRYQA